jgi:hypothetical protein
MERTREDHVCLSVDKAANDVMQRPYPTIPAETKWRQSLEKGVNLWPDFGALRLRVFAVAAGSPANLGGDSTTDAPRPEVRRRNYWV